MKPSSIIACGGLAALSIMAIIEILVLKYEKTVEEQKEEILRPPVSEVISSSVPDIVTTGSVGYTEKDIAMTDEELKKLCPQYRADQYVCWTCEVRRVKVPVYAEDDKVIGTNWIHVMDVFDHIDANWRLKR